MFLFIFQDKLRSPQHLLRGFDDLLGAPGRELETVVRLLTQIHSVLQFLRERSFDPVGIELPQSDEQGVVALLPVAPLEQKRSRAVEHRVIALDGRPLGFLQGERFLGVLQVRPCGLDLLRDHGGVPHNPHDLALFKQLLECRTQTVSHSTNPLSIRSNSGLSSLRILANSSRSAMIGARGLSLLRLKALTVFLAVSRSSVRMRTSMSLSGTSVPSAALPNSRTFLAVSLSLSTNGRSAQTFQRTLSCLTNGSPVFGR